MRRVALALVVLGVAGAARAQCTDAGGGSPMAFPDELGVFAPTDQPSDIVVTTNFGLLESTDDGLSWFYICAAEVGCNDIGSYELGPTDALLADTFDGLHESSDLGCLWTPAGGTLAGAYAWTAAFDPNNPGAVLALSQPPDAGEPSASAIYPSTDNGLTFGPPVYATAAGLSGIQFSASSPGLVYVTGNGPPADGGVASYGNAFVLVGVDGGASWGAQIAHPELNAELAADAGVGPAPPPAIRLAAIDPVDSQTVYFFLSPPNSGQSVLAVSHDGGKTIEILFDAPEPITAFLIGSDETLYVGTRNTTGDGGLFAAPPGAGAFQVVHQACADGGSGGSCDIHVRALAERAGLLYAAADDFVDHMALGASSDRGVHFMRLLQFKQIYGGLGCAGTKIEATCGAEWTSLQELFGVDAGPQAQDGGPIVSTPPNGGCHGCGTAGDGALLLAVLAVVALVRRRATVGESRSVLQPSTDAAPSAVGWLRRRP